MRLRATPLYIALLYSIFFNINEAQSQISLGNDTTLNCGTTCFNIKAKFIAEYSIDSTNINFASHEPFTFGSTAGITLDNRFSSAIALPFTFCYYGQNYTDLVIGSNGIISFNTANANQPCVNTITGTLPSNTYHVPSIIPAFHDLDPSLGGQITYGTVGTAPNQKFVINYYQVPQAGACNTDISTFQVILDEATGAIEFYIQDKPACLTDVNGGNAISGLQNSNTQVITLDGKDGTNVWGGMGFNKAYRFVPNGLPTVHMIGFFGNLTAPSSVAATGIAEYTATFNNICPIHDTATYMVRVVYDQCGVTTTYYDTFFVSRPTPVIGSYSFGNPTTCSGTDGTITLGGLLPATTYDVTYLKNTIATGPASFTTNGFGSLVITGLGIGNYDDIRVTLGTCQSNNYAGPVTLTDPPAPAIGGVSKTDPDSCNIANGSITLTGLQAGGSYTVNLLKNTVAQPPVLISADGTGTLIIPNMGAGAYTGITVTRLNCTSAPEAITLVDPALPTVTASNNGPLCEGATLNLGATNVTGATFSWTGPNTYTSASQNPTIGTTVLVDAGTYTVTASVNNCTSLPSNTVVVINPLPTTTGATPASPTTCLGTNGSITFTGLSASTSYTINYTFNSAAQTPLTISSNASGVLVMNNLGAGTYDNITFTTAGCTSLQHGPYTITDPAPPAVPTAGNNGPLCVGATLNLTASTIPGVTYSWTGPNSFTSSVQNPSRTNMQLADAGVYSVTATANNCTSLAGSTTVVVNPVPVIGSTSSTNPTTCSGLDGTITLNGLTASTSYTVDYLRGGLPQTATISTNGTGTLVITGLPAATYSNITVTLNGCTSGSVGPITLNNPPTPAAPTAGNNGPLCAGATLNLTASTVPGASYSWSGPATFGSAVQNPTLPNAQPVNAGVYSVIAIVAGCPSAPATTTVVVNPLPTTTGGTVTHPTTCLGTNGFITFTGLTASASYTVNYTRNSIAQAPQTISANASGVLVLNNLDAGTYDNITFTLNGCTSAPVGPYTVSDPVPPSAPTAGNNGPLCEGATLNLTASTIPGVTYSWTGPNSFTSNVQNPSVTNITLAGAGVYSVTATANNCVSTAGTTAVVVNPLPVIASVTSSNPTTCLGTDGSITLNGLSASTSYTVNYLKNTVPQSATISSTGLGTLIIANLTAGTYASITVTLNGCTSAPSGPVTLSDPSAPAAPTAGNNGPICAGNTLNLTATNVSGATYSWTGPNSFSSNLQNPTRTNMQAADAGVYSVTVTVANCISTAATTTVVVNPVPAITGGTPTSPTICSGTNGYITFTGLAASTSYSISYTRNSVAQTPVTISSNASGVLVLTNLDAGTYDNIIFTLNGCSSAPAGPYIITDPVPPAAPTAGSNSPVCEGSTLNLTASTVSGATYSWTGPNTFSSTTQNPSITNVTLAAAGVYSVTVTVNNCVSAAGTTVVVVNPLPVIATVTSSNPTTCSGTDGSISLTGLAAGVSYTVNYTRNTVPVSATISADASGVLVITGLNAATYANITVTRNGCTSAAVGPVTLTDPAVPAAPTAGNNGPLCVGATLILTASNVPGGSYNWTGPNSFSSLVQNPSILSVATTDAGVYSVTVTVNNCVSAAATTTVVVNPVPAIASVTSTNPTTCSGANGTISLTGLTPAASYTVNYTRNTIPVAATIVANASGVVIITGLDAATYAGFTVTLNGCTSAATGNVTLTDPALPVVTAGSNTPLCAGATLNLTATTVAGATYSWTGPGAYTSISQNPSITGITVAQAGTYTVTATLNNCTSLPSSTNVVVNPIPATPTLGNNGPLCVGATLNLTASTVAGATYTWTGPSSFSSNVQNPSIINAQATHAGVYSVTTTANGCTSPAASTTVVVNPVPAIASVTSTNPTTCAGTNGTISLTGLTPSASYTVNYTRNTVPQTAMIVANASGVVIITGLNAGTYAGFTVTLNGCTSTATGNVTLTDPALPVVTAGSNTPLCAGATLNLTATTVAGATYSWTGPGTYTSTSQNPTITGITVAQAGTYTVTATLNNCTSLPSSTIVIVNPIPATPTAGNNGPLCAGATLNLTASTVAGATYTWSGPSSYSSTTQNPSITNAQAAVSGTYSVTASANGCTSPAATTNVVINPIPATPTAGSNSPVCVGSPINLTASTVAGATYSWTGPSYTSNTQNPVIATAALANAGTYSVTATISGCVSAAGTTNVVVNPLPAAPATSNLIYCQFAPSAALTATGTGLKWYTVATAGTPLASAPTPSTATAGTTTWYVSQTVTGCEGPRAALTVTITAKPAAPLAAVTITYCEGQPATPLTATGTNLLWYTTPTGGTGSATAPTPSTATAGTVNYYVSQTVNSCESDRATTAVTVNPVPAAPTVNSPVTYCEGSPATPALNTFVTGTNLKWYTGPTGGTGSTTTPTINTSVTGTTTYYVSQSVGSCESGRTAIVVNVNAKPAMPGVTNVSYCQINTPAPLTATGTSLLWYTSATGGTGSATAPTPSTATPGVTNYYVSQTVNGCESDRAQIEVTIFTKPPMPAATASYTYCQGETTSALSATGTNLQWYTAPTGGTGATTVPVPSSTTPGVYDWYVSQTVSGCESDRTHITVTVNAKPQPPTASTMYFCEGDPETPVTATGQNLKWYISQSGGTGSTTAPLQATTTPGTFNYYVSQTILGCESDRATLTVVVSGKVTADFTVSKDTTCASDTIVVTFTGQAPSGAAFTWNFNGANIISGSGSGPYQVQWPSEGAKEIELKLDNDNCSATSKKKVFLKYAPIAYFNTHMNGCTNEPIEVTADVVQYVSYSWSFGGADIISGSGYGPYELKWNEPGLKVIKLILTNNQCNSLPFIDTIDVHNAPEARIEGLTSNDVCSQDTLTLSTKPGNNFTYQWLPERFFPVNNANEVVAVISGEGYIRLRVTDDAGCTSSDSMYLNTRACCDMFLPDAFTPNGDGKNDIFRARAEGARELFHLRIANRWGQIVFDTSDPTQGWDGRFRGEPQGIGTYQYYVRFKCSGGEMNEKSGSITLLR